MEKVVYLLEQSTGANAAAFVEKCLAETVGQIRQAGGTRIQLNIVDEQVAPASGLRFVTGEQPPDATLSVWLPSAIDEMRAPVDLAIKELSVNASACVVTESQPIVAPLDTDPSHRAPGFAQLAFLHRPSHLTVDEWLDQWLNHHTRIAIDTQATFGYTQNIVTRWLFGESRYDAIVEELFPMSAMNDPHVFYDAVGDDDLLKRNRTEMMNSVTRFVDLNRIDVIATSQYRI